MPRELASSSQAPIIDLTEDVDSQAPIIDGAIDLSRAIYEDADSQDSRPLDVPNSVTAIDMSRPFQVPNSITMIKTDPGIHRAKASRLRDRRQLTAIDITRAFLIPDSVAVIGLDRACKHARTSGEKLAQSLSTSSSSNSTANVTVAHMRPLENDEVQAAYSWNSQPRDDLEWEEFRAWEDERSRKRSQDSNNP